jgi:hypothetical protein
MLTIRNEYWEDGANGISAIAVSVHNDVRTHYNRSGSNSGSAKRRATRAGSSGIDNDDDGVRRWHRNSGEIYSGRQSDVTSHIVGQRPRSYGDLPFAHA